MKAEELVNLIRKRYCFNRPDSFQSYVLLEQVPDGTGMYQSRWVDAVVFGLWESKGLTRFAFEVKVSRSDFLHELQNQTKHKWCLECFHEFWFVAPQNVIQLEELPPKIGWLCPRGNKLIIKRHAIKNANPKLDDILLAGFMRASSKEIERIRQFTIKDVLVKSEEYQRAKVYQDAITYFLSQRGNTQYLDPTTVEQVVKWLDDATMDKQLKQDREQLLNIASRFQRAVIGLLNLFLIIASKSLLARDELGKYIVSSYGGQDNESLEILREYSKNSKALESQRRYVGIVELLMNWEKFNQ